MKGPTEPQQRSYEFGPFRLDPAERALLRDGSPVPLLPKSFDALVVLVRNSGRLLDKDFLLAEIWPDTHVEENNLAHAIWDIRKALGEGPKDPRYVVTVPRRGYRFAAAVATVENVPAERGASIAQPLNRSLDEAPAAPPTPDIVPPIVSLPPSLSEGRRPPRWLVFGVAATAFAVAILSLGVMLLSRQPHPPPLGDKDVLVLADFTNNTGEAVFDGTLREALAVQLEHSAFLKVMDEARVRHSLRLMGRPPDQRVTDDVAHEVCVREREKATIGGSITALGGSYAIILHALNCDTGETLARVQVEAKNKAGVLAALANAATGMRHKLGESLSSIQQLERHAVTEVTTPSLEAFQAYARGADQYRRGLSLQAVPFFRRAVELDPDFAMAFQLLGNAYGNVGEDALAIEYSRRAFALIDRVSERERLAISAVYHMRVTGDAAKSADAVHLFVQTFPRAPTPRAYRASFYGSMGQFEKRVEDCEELIRLDPRSWIGYMALMEAYTRLSQFEKAHGVWEKAMAQKLDAPRFHYLALEMALMQDDDAGGEREITWFEGRDDEYLSLELQASRAIVRGQRGKASDLLKRAAEKARRANLHAPANVLSEASAADPFGDCQVGDGLVAALRACADIHAALRDVEGRSKERPADTLLATVHVPTRRAVVELRRNQAARALELLEPAAPFERAYPEVIYLRGLAHLRMRNGAGAATEFRKIIDHKGATWGPRYPLAYLGLARAAMQVGDIGAARKAYQDLFALWKDADRDLPILIAAKKEYAAVH